MLKSGDIAPNFLLEDQNNKFVSLSDFAGKNVVLFFYPKDFTPGCTAESCSFRDSSDEFAKFNTQIIGISKDNASSHQRFISKHQLSYPLLTDPDGSVASQFGVSKSLGIFPGRATFVIDDKGIIKMAFSSQFNISKHVEGALAVVKALYGSGVKS